ncbi:hypothetical protein BJ165DRAFT_1402231 [Panaeolus papilionaceus]|nr:hypothetical protein BJ165DRAFT_1402231 [Panaeolus papilionaceus]
MIIIHHRIADTHRPLQDRMAAASAPPPLPTGAGVSSIPPPPGIVPASIPIPPSPVPGPVSCSGPALTPTHTTVPPVASVSGPGPAPGATTPNIKAAMMTTAKLLPGVPCMLEGCDCESSRAWRPDRKRAERIDRERAEEREREWRDREQQQRERERREYREREMREREQRERVGREREKQHRERERERRESKDEVMGSPERVASPPVGGNGNAEGGSSPNPNAIVASPTPNPAIASPNPTPSANANANPSINITNGNANANGNAGLTAPTTHAMMPSPPISHSSAESDGEGRRKKMREEDDREERREFKDKEGREDREGREERRERERDRERGEGREDRKGPVSALMGSSPSFPTEWGFEEWCSSTFEEKKNLNTLALMKLIPLPDLPSPPKAGGSRAPHALRLNLPKLASFGDLIRHHALPSAILLSRKAKSMVNPTLLTRFWSTALAGPSLPAGTNRPKRTWHTIQQALVRKRRDTGKVPKPCPPLFAVKEAEKVAVLEWTKGWLQYQGTETWYH